jgi:hypothetical protein
MDELHIQFGKLLGAFGKPAAHEGYTFGPAKIELSGKSFTIGFDLADSIAGRPPVILARPLRKNYDAAWVRARLPRVFGFTPELSDMEKSLLDVGFVAAPNGSSVGIPFVCTDYYGRTGLTFSPDGPDAGTKAKIAAAFWSLLIVSPEDLEDFAATVMHPGAGVWMHFGCKSGVPTYSESGGDEE